MATIKEYLDNLPDMRNKNGETLKEAMAKTVSIWDNNACKGYALIALNRLGYSKDEMQKVLENIQLAFEDYSTEDAEKMYCEYIN